MIKTYEFSDQNVDKIIYWIRRYICESSSTGFPKIVVGVSGGKDSSVVAALCIRAVGKENVELVFLPDKVDTKASERVKQLGIFLNAPIVTIKITPILNHIYNNINTIYETDCNDVVVTNTPARIRMSILYAVAGQCHGRVANTSNLSESYVGWDTKWGDQCGDFAPIQHLTASEVCSLGRALGLPDELIDCDPDDGMRGVTDEEAWGFTYNELDTFLMLGSRCVDNEEAVKKIESMHKRALHKLGGIVLPGYETGFKIEDPF